MLRRSSGRSCAVSPALTLSDADAVVRMTPSAAENAVFPAQTGPEIRDAPEPMPEGYLPYFYSEWNQTMVSLI